MHNFETIKVTISEEAARITFNRPPLNILNIQMMEEINEALIKFQNEEVLKLIIFDAEGKAFSAGVDILDHKPEKIDKMLEEFHNIFHNLYQLEVPTLAIVRGMALGGGCEIALFCDMILATEKAKFGQPEPKVGVFPPVAAVMLPKLIGLKKSYELLYSGDTIDAAEAYRLGLVNKILEGNDEENQIAEFIKKFTSLSSVVLKLTKRAIEKGLDKNFTLGLKYVEDIYQKTLMKSEDAIEGLNAFMEKRAPKWKNK